MLTLSRAERTSAKDDIHRIAQAKEAFAHYRW